MAPSVNENVEQRLSIFLDKNLEKEQLYFNIYIAILIILIISIVVLSI